MAKADHKMDELELLLAELVDGQLTPDQFCRLEFLLQQAPEARKRYRAHMQVHAGLAWNFHQPQAKGMQAPVSPMSASQPALGQPPHRPRRWVGLLSMVACGLLVIMAYGVWLKWGHVPHPDLVQAHAPKAISGARPSMEPGGAKFVGLAAASFFGELGPALGSTVELGRNYALRSGLVQLRFACGASAIVEGPAIFRVSSKDCLSMDVGNCSVYAPPGAEGFSIRTPVTRVVDRGTRFAVSVAENSQTEVQVVEGSADVYRHELQAETGTRQPGSVRQPHITPLTNDSVDKVDVSNESTAFVSSRYRPSTPDRVISYRAIGPQDRAEELTHVSVQRGGQVREYPVDSLIPAKLIWFRGSRTDFVGGPSLTSPRANAIGDANLTTGIINPGGSRLPLTTSPVLVPGDQPESEGSGTPGMGLRFRKPIINNPGPDVVLFEIQMMTDPVEGDAFHVSPLEFKPGLRTHTVTRFDLDMSMQEALEVRRVYFHTLEEPAKSMEQFETLDYSTRLLPHAFHALAVGIDLSDLGFAEGEAVEGLFIQDLEDDRHRIDPVYIAGLPPLGES